MNGIAVVLLGTVPESLLAGLVPSQPPWNSRPRGLPRMSPGHCSVPLPSRFMDSDGSIRADLLLREKNWLPEQGRGVPGQRLLIITPHPLSTRECSRVLGLSARRRGVAVISAWGLGGDSRRLRNLALHELGHLEGRRHCRTPGCLMNPVKDPGDLNARSDSLCGDCAGRGAS